MPTLKNNPKSGGQVKRNGQHSKADMARIEREEFPRDNLKGAYAGRQNSDGNASISSKNTNVKGRDRLESRDKTPKR